MSVPQVPQPGSLSSRVLDREMEYFWVGDAGRPVLLFPTSAGRHNENIDFGLAAALDPLVKAGAIQLCSIDSINRESWADEGLKPEEKLRRQELYDRHLSEELLPHVARRSGRSDPVLFGASLGAWQAATFAARHPDQVGRVVAFSGFFDLRQLMDDWWSDTCYFYSPVDFVPNMDPSWVRRLKAVDWVLATGDGDPLAQETRRFGSILDRLGIPVSQEIWPDCFGHDWPHWKEHLPDFLP